MNFLIKNKTILISLFALFLIFHFFTANHFNEKYFVGKWHSTKLATPIHLYGNGEWEIKKEDGAILQYGVWEYKNNKLIWSYKLGSDVGHDLDPLTYVNEDEFKVLESDKTTTTFSRLKE